MAIKKKTFINSKDQGYQDNLIFFSQNETKFFELFASKEIALWTSAIDFYGYKL